MNVRCSRAALSLLCALLVLSSGGAQASTLNAETRARYLAVANQVHDAGQITDRQLRDTRRWLNLQPCSSARTALDANRKFELARAISESEGFPNSTVLTYIGFQSWHIVLTTAGLGDPPYLVYREDPAKGGKPVASWAGAATIFETTELRDWLLANAPGIPRRLADCWAWQVTLGQ